MPMPFDTDAVHYPDSDGEPMAENARQALIIRTLILGFERRFSGRRDAWVGGDCFWYPVQGDPRTVTAPDVIVVTDLPAPIDVRSLGSYRQWEHGPPPLLVVEVLSPSNTPADMIRKLAFYDQFGVREYWVVDPDHGLLEIHWRDGDRLVPAVHPEEGWVSPFTSVRVSMVDGEVVVVDPDGERRWLAPIDEAHRADEAVHRADELAARVAELEQRLRDLGG